jgi:hypothetical protein
MLMEVQEATQWKRSQIEKFLSCKLLIANPRVKLLLSEGIDILLLSSPVGPTIAAGKINIFPTIAATEALH